MSENHQIPTDTTPVWQIELLLSGGLIFGVFQIIDWVDRMFADFYGVLDGAPGQVIASVYLLALCALFALGAAFSMHLLMRSFWVALIGIRSIWPNGVRWTEVSRSARTTQFMQRHLPSLPEAIENADNSSTLIFACGIALVGLVSFSAATIILLMLISALLAFSLPNFGSHFNWFLFVLTAFFGSLLLVQLIDRLVGARVSDSSFSGRALTKLIGLQKYMMPRSISLMTTVMTSNFGRVRGVVLMVSASWLLIFLVEMRIDLKADSVMSYFTRYLPQTSNTSMQTEHYRDQRTDGAQVSSPFLAKMIVTDSYQQLFVPYRHAHFEQLISERCPAVAKRPKNQKTTNAGEPERVQTLLACLKTELKPTLDQQSISANFQLTSDAATKAPQLMLMIDVRELALGEHEVAIQFPSLSKRDTNQAIKLETVRIKFWR